jgi:hypothetical protein
MEVIKINCESLKYRVLLQAFSDLYQIFQTSKKFEQLHIPFFNITFLTQRPVTDSGEHRDEL